MDNDAAFLEGSWTFAILAAGTAPTPIQLLTGGNLGSSPLTGSQITAKILNSGTVVNAVSHATTAALALSQCTLPVPGTPQNVLVLAGGEDITITVPPGQFWTAIGAGTIYIQTGFGI